MIGTPLLVGPDEVTKLTALREKAARLPVEMTGLLDRLKLPKLKAAHMRQMSDQTVYLGRYAVTFSIETGHPAGTARHMSMSVDREGRVPNEHAVWMIAEYLGFVGSLRECSIWLEKLQGHGQAVNVVQPLNIQKEAKSCM